jgi:hypothetical protein
VNREPHACDVDAPGLRPESIRVDSSGTLARIIAVEPMGREVLYSADCALGRVHFLEAGAEARHREGDNVALAFSPGDALLFDELFLHKTGSDPSMPNPRFAIENWFFGGSAFPPEFFPVAI